MKAAETKKDAVTAGKKRTVRRTPQVSAVEKCRAVLSLWTERRTATELCRELSVAWAQLALWQDKALEGMVKALEVQRKTKEREVAPPLSIRLQRLLAKKGLATERKAPEPMRRLEELQTPAPSAGHGS